MRGSNIDQILHHYIYIYIYIYMYCLHLRYYVLAVCEPFGFHLHICHIEHLILVTCVPPSPLHLRIKAMSEQVLTNIYT